MKQTDDPQIFESRFDFIQKHTKYLEQKLDDVQQTMTDKAQNLEKTVQNALNKYKEIETVTDLISVGISPQNIEFQSENANQSQMQPQPEQSDAINNEEKKL